MTNITIKSFDDNSYWVHGNNISLSITWNGNTNRWNVNATSENALVFDLGDGPLPDLTSAIQFIIESTPLNMGDSLDEDSMKVSHIESEQFKWEDFYDENSE
jgi:hypothetical protein